MNSSKGLVKWRENRWAQKRGGLGEIGFAVAAALSIARETLRCFACLTCSETNRKVSKERNPWAKWEANVGGLWCTGKQTSTQQGAVWLIYEKWGQKNLFVGFWMFCLSRRVSGVGMNRSCSVTMTENSRGICSKRWHRLDEKAVPRSLWNERKGVSRVLQEVTTKAGYEKECGKQKKKREGNSK